MKEDTRLKAINSILRQLLTEEIQDNLEYKTLFHAPIYIERYIETMKDSIQDSAKNCIKDIIEDRDDIDPDIIFNEAISSTQAMLIYYATDSINYMVNFIKNRITDKLKEVILDNQVYRDNNILIDLASKLIELVIELIEKALNASISDYDLYVPRCIDRTMNLEITKALFADKNGITCVFISYDVSNMLSQHIKDGLKVFRDDFKKYILDRVKNNIENSIHKIIFRRQKILNCVFKPY